LIVYLCLCQELLYYCVVCHRLRRKIVQTMWFQLVILSIVVLFIIIMWDRSSYIDLLMFYGLACLSFLRISFLWIPIVIDVFFRSTTIVFEITGISAPYSFPTISYWFYFREKNVKMKVIWPPIDRFHPYAGTSTCQYPAAKYFLRP